ncbi:MAG: hypothetical protein EOO55_03530 [Hymenobacter sp.]|nr:MAG: hypothetical protein EOO55_03530 [Hymenobacter sp.]
MPYGSESWCRCNCVGGWPTTAPRPPTRRRAWADADQLLPQKKRPVFAGWSGSGWEKYFRNRKVPQGAGWPVSFYWQLLARSWLPAGAVAEQLGTWAGQGG